MVSSLLLSLSIVLNRVSIGYGNYLANGALGWTLISAGLVFEATGDIRFLDTVVRIADK